MTDSTYHLVGVGGIGMSAIARLLLARGARVSGSDVSRSALVACLEAEGVRVSVGQCARNVGADVGTVVVSSAIARDNPELVAARERGLAVLTRGEMLAELARGHRLVAVAGTHGKTTTTAMLATIFEHAGLDPTVAIGGVRVDTGSNARAGAGAWFVTEADESDGSFLHLSPTVAVVNNIENDHIASDAELPKLLAQFAAFVAKVPAAGRAVVGADNRASARARARRAGPGDDLCHRRGRRRGSDRGRDLVRRSRRALHRERARPAAGRDRAPRAGRDQRPERARRARARRGRRAFRSRWWPRRWGSSGAWSGASRSSAAAR